MRRVFTTLQRAGLVPAGATVRHEPGSSTPAISQTRGSRLCGHAGRHAGHPCLDAVPCVENALWCRPNDVNRGADMAYRCAILDDYQNVALKLADWSKSRRRDQGVQRAVRRPTTTRRGAQGLPRSSCMMRERTHFPARRDRGAAQAEAADHHRRLRNASIDMRPAPSAASWSAAPARRPSDRRAHLRPDARARPAGSAGRTPA